MTRTTMGRLRLAPVTMAAAAALLAGCGGSDDDGGGTAQATACADLLKASVQSVPTVIDTAERIDATTAAPWTSPNGGGGAATVTQGFCRVAGSVRPTATSDIRFELWMPLQTAWNNKFAGTASGGSNGYIAYGTVNTHLGMGYASIGHDNGHRAADTGFALDPEKKIDFAHRAQHVVTLVGKELTRAHYGNAPKYAYYNGCSQSGHHGIMEMQRYPDDYDGIVAGAPANDWTGTLAAEANAALAQWGTPGAGVPKALQTAFRQRVFAACEGKPGIDSAVDGVLDDPRRCKVDPSVMQCGTAGVDPAACFTAPQVQALRTALDGRRTSTGELVALPYPVDAIGGNFFPTEKTSPTAPQGSWANHWTYAVFADPNYSFNSFNWDNDVTYARGKEGALYDAISGDYSAFANRGGKLLTYHGAADSLIPVTLAIEQWNRMNAQMGAAKVQSFARLYLVPGMDHCGGGAGTGNFNLLSALSDWVEKGIAPDGTTAANTPIASRAANATAGLTARTRPLCPYPKVAVYKGSGSVDDAANFSCGVL